MEHSSLSDYEKDLIRSVLRELDSATQAAINTREQSRVEVNKVFWIKPLGPKGAQKLVKIMARNISATGLGAICRKSFPVGQHFVVPLHFPGKEPKLVLCRISFCRQVDENLFELGAEMTADIPDSDGSVAIPQLWIDLSSGGLPG